ncbi:MAG: AAA family ATPase [Candidatus Omnitrophica bacterium]|nr:AAA family ATPase [Candidatus Omnitrophota bacterium]
MKVISIVNQKGGCGKTTLSVNIAATLAKFGKNTLLIDLDPQAHATYALGYSRKAAEAKTSYDIFRAHLDESEIALDDIILRNRPNFSFIPSNMVLSTAEINLGNVEGAAAILSESLANYKGEDYEYVIIDSPPSFGFLTLNSMYAADILLVPIDLSYFSFNAINSIYRVKGILNSETGKQPEVFFVLNIFDGRSNFAMQLERDVKARVGNFLMSTKIRSCVRLREASGLGKSIFEHDPKSQAALDFYNVTTELLEMGSRDMNLHVKEFLVSAPLASSVYVLGDFNGWKKTEVNKLTKFEDGKWGGHFSLPKGRHRYKFLVDGNWMHDDSNPVLESNIFGSIDSVIEL